MAVLTLTTVALLSLAFCCVASQKGLHLRSYSEDEVRGCYEYNQTLGVCFDAKKGAMKIKKTTGEEIVHYRDLGHDMFLYQVLDQPFIGYGPSMFHVPENIRRESEALRKFARKISGNGITQQETLINHYQAAMSDLHYVPEVQLLERLSSALGGNSKRLEILQPFHALCLSVLKASDVEVPDELRAAPNTEDETADQHEREKRCSRPTANKCLGMCGLGCWCWSWVCDDCCLHRGCYEHDVCCSYGYWTSYCAVPFIYGFSCSKFGGYPKCKSGSLGWK